MRARWHALNSSSDFITHLEFSLHFVECLPTGTHWTPQMTSELIFIFRSILWNPCPMACTELLKWHQKSYSLFAPFCGMRAHWHALNSSNDFRTHIYVSLHFVEPVPNGMHWTPRMTSEVIFIFRSILWNACPLARTELLKWLQDSYLFFAPFCGTRALWHALNPSNDFRTYIHFALHFVECVPTGSQWTPQMTSALIFIFRSILWNACPLARTELLKWLQNHIHFFYFVERVPAGIHWTLQMTSELIL
jgi:hypothetical protein